MLYWEPMLAWKRAFLVCCDSVQFSSSLAEGVNDSLGNAIRETETWADLASARVLSLQHLLEASGVSVERLFNHINLVSLFVEAGSLSCLVIHCGQLSGEVRHLWRVFEHSQRRLVEVWRLNLVSHCLLFLRLIVFCGRLDVLVLASIVEGKHLHVADALSTWRWKHFLCDRVALLVTGASQAESGSTGLGGCWVVWCWSRYLGVDISVHVISFFADLGCLLRRQSLFDRVISKSSLFVLQLLEERLGLVLERVELLVGLVSDLIRA